MTSCVYDLFTKAKNYKTFNLTLPYNSVNFESKLS